MSAKFRFLVVTVCLCLAAVPALAQNAQPPVLLSVHEDNVIPSKIEEYEKAAVGLVKAVQKHKVSSISYTAASMDDYTYIYFTPVESLGAVDKIGASFGELQEKMGKDAFGATMGAFDGCYLTHRNYLVRLRPDLSYKPEYGAKISDGLNFRHWSFFYIHPGMETEAEALAKEWVAFYEKMKTPEGYRLYVNSYGLEGPVFIIVQSGKSAAEFYSRVEAWRKRAGDAGEALRKRTMKVASKYESKDGMIRPDLSVSPESVVSSK